MFDVKRYILRESLIDQILLKVLSAQASSNETLRSCVILWILIANLCRMNCSLLRDQRLHCTTKNHRPSQDNNVCTFFHLHHRGKNVEKFAFNILKIKLVVALIALLHLEIKLTLSL